MTGRTIELWHQAIIDAETDMLTIMGNDDAEYVPLFYLDASLCEKQTGDIGMAIKIIKNDELLGENMSAESRRAYARAVEKIELIMTELSSTLAEDIIRSKGLMDKYERVT